MYGDSVHCISFAVLAFGVSTLGSSQANALSCPGATIAKATDVLVVTYYLTASSCTTTNPGTGVLLSATIDDNNVSVTFSPGSTVVTSSMTTPASDCIYSITPPFSGNVAGYQFGNATKCTVSIALSDGGSLSFVADDALDGYANSFTSVNFTAGPMPSWTLTAVPNTASFTAAGQAIGYSYTLTNTGNITINSIALAGTKTGTISCLASSLALGASTTCTSTYTTTAGEVGAAIPYSVTATGTPTGGTLAKAVANGSIAFSAQSGLVIAVTPSPTTFSKAGQIVSFSYKVTNAGNVAINSITVSDTKISGIACPASTLSTGAATTCSGSYTTTAADVIAGSISGTAIAQGVFGAVPVASPPVTTTVQLDTNAVRRATQSAIRNFMNCRAEVVAAIQPDSSGNINGCQGGCLEMATRNRTTPRKGIPRLRVARPTPLRSTTGWGGGPAAVSRWLAILVLIERTG